MVEVLSICLLRYDSSLEPPGHWTAPQTGYGGSCDCRGESWAGDMPWWTYRNCQLTYCAVVPIPEGVVSSALFPLAFSYRRKGRRLLPYCDLAMGETRVMSRQLSGGLVPHTKLCCTTTKLEGCNLRLERYP